MAYVLGTSAGGTGSHVAMLARGCASRGMTVTVYGPAGTGERFFARASWSAGDQGHGPAAGRRADSGAASPAAPCFVPVEIAERPRPARDAVAVLRLRRLLARSAPGVVHAHGLRAGAFAALALAGRRRGHRCPLVVTVHNAPVTGGMAGVLHGVLARIAARRADLVTCVSPDLAQNMQALGAAVGGIAVVPAAPAARPSAAEVARARRELGDPGGPGDDRGAGDDRRPGDDRGAGEDRGPGGLGKRGAPGRPGPPIVLAVGRLAPQKGFAALLEAAARWQSCDPRPRVAIVGEGPLAGDLLARAADGGLDVRFLGRRGDVPALLAAADVVAVPSLWEGQPLIVAEALRAGRPVVAFRVGGIAGMTGGQAALLVPPGDTAAFAEAVLAVLGDPALATALGASALARAAMLPGVTDAIDAAVGLYRRALAA